MNAPLAKAIALFGTQGALADVIGTDQGMVSYWLNEAKHGVSPRFCPLIEQATNGVVTCKELRPDIYPPSSRSIATITLPRHKEKAGAVARRTPASVSAKGGL